MNEKTQTMHCYVIQSQLTNTKAVSTWTDENFFHWDDRSDEELKKAAFGKMKVLENVYRNEKFRLILREEFEQIIEE